MLGTVLGLMLMAAQDAPPLAGTLPPMPAPLPREEPRSRTRLFISPMGEPFRAPDPVRVWFEGADTDHDGAVSAAEFVADAMRFFAVLDRGRDGEIDPEDIDYYETKLAPEIRTGGEIVGGSAPRAVGRRGGGRRGQGGDSGGGGPGSFSFGDGGGAKAPRYADTRRGAARYSFFDYPEPVVAADTNLNRGIDAQEFRAAALDRFAMLDKKHNGRLTRGELPALAAPPAGRAGGFGGRRPTGPPPGGEDRTEE